MKREERIAFYKEIIPAFSSPRWEFAEHLNFLDPIAAHPLEVSDPDLDVDGSIVVHSNGRSTSYSVVVKSGRREYPRFLAHCYLRELAQFKSCTESIIQPSFEELREVARRSAQELIAKNRNEWIAVKKQWEEKHDY